MRQRPSPADAREGEVKSGLALRVGLVQCAKSVRPYGNRIDDMPASPPSSNHLTTPARTGATSLSLIFRPYAWHTTPHTSHGEAIRW